MLGRQPSPLLAPAAGELPQQALGALSAALDEGLARSVLLTMGPLGAVLASAGPGGDGGGPAWPPVGAASWRVDVDAASLLEAGRGGPPDVPPLSVAVERVELPGPAEDRRCLRYRLLRPLASVRDVTGAGDALVGGTAAARAAGWPLGEAVVAGLTCAHLTLFADGAVAPFLGPELLGRLRGALAVGTSSRL
ncbi:unnamed protein product [Prorocentrum cordatum]|uniref:Carbohydrate kinase PfkB domain-containing protein n=1 Tax=Prorocentrum cordatum TaxID=2364126 RepID=A0ABN9RKA5_9DINO|nr:unnamed protein product [Polarella glacialis]